MLERGVLNKLTKYTESESGLSEMYFGFRKGRSNIDATLDATRTVVDAMQTSQKQQRRGNPDRGEVPMIKM